MLNRNAKQMGCLSLSGVIAGRCFAWGVWLVVASRGWGTEVRFNRDVRPILAEHCFACHGPDAAQREANLRLDQPGFQQRRSDSGDPLVVAGQPGQSLLIRRIRAHEPDQVMPPPSSLKPLSSRQIGILEQWVAAGAPYESHWAYLPIQKAPLPEVDRSDWPRHAIDRFVLAGLSAAGLKQSPAAPPATLLRRLSLDLTGLPPTPLELDHFLQDRSPDAYERAVDRFLTSERFGERMAIDWLDAARYADTNGYQVDRDREMYAWRDWVIQAFNRNMPFDQFTIEQLAGDLLPQATRQQQIATGFHRNHMTNEETGIIPEEFIAEYTADRVETTATVWLGQTMNCARCHDHKFDPWTQRDFYSLKAFFHNVPERGIGDYGASIRTSNPPYLALPTPAQAQQLNALRAAVAEHACQMAEREQSAWQAIPAWHARALGRTQPQPMSVPFNRFRADAPHAQYDAPQHAIALTAGKQVQLHGTCRPRHPTALRLTWQTAEMLKVEWTSCSVRNVPGNGTRWRLFALPNNTAAQGNTAEQGNPAQPSNTAAQGNPAQPSNTAQPGESVLDDDPTNSQTIDLIAGASTSFIFGLTNASIVHDEADVELQLTLKSVAGRGQLRVEWLDLPVDQLLPTQLETLLTRPRAAWSDSDLSAVQQFLLACQPEYRTLRGQTKALREKQNQVEQSIATTLVMQEMREPRPTQVLQRGLYDRPTEMVRPDTPAALPPFSPQSPRNRLGLAQWLVGPDNPLTARVIVNRYWQMLFGVGLVRSSEDFGSQGTPPTHPELLDWLAHDFMHNGWDVKRLLKQMVMSSTYRQSSHREGTQGERDPENVWWGRANRYRLSAEAIRDQAFFVSGLLVPHLGGPSVKPYHPEGLYEQVVAGRGPNTYVRDTGQNLYRRSLYTYWKRSVPHPAMLLFDAPFRESCVVRRPRTNTPLQALNLMNDPTYLEAAAHLALRMVSCGETNLEAQLRCGFRLVTSRDAQASELAPLAQLYHDCLTDFQHNPALLDSLLVTQHPLPASVGDRARWGAMSVVASVLLNLDETITRE